MVRGFWMSVKEALLTKPLGSALGAYSFRKAFAVGTSDVD